MHMAKKGNIKWGGTRLTTKPLKIPTLNNQTAENAPTK